MMSLTLLLVNSYGFLVLFSIVITSPPDEDRELVYML